MASLSQGRTAAAQCGLFTSKSVPVIFEPPCTIYLHKKLHIVDSISPLVLAVKMKAKLMPYYPFVAYFTTLSVSLHTTWDTILK